MITTEGCLRRAVDFFEGMMSASEGTSITLVIVVIVKGHCISHTANALVLGFLALALHCSVTMTTMTGPAATAHSQGRRRAPSAVDSAAVPCCCAGPRASSTCSRTVPQHSGPIPRLIDAGSSSRRPQT